jgi:oligopeptide transport system permease protein
VEAAISLGLPAWKIIFRHILPNVLGPVIVYATLTVPAVMLLEAGLSFLGLGVQPPGPSWGTLINDGSKNIETSWWMLAFPAACFSATLFCLNFAGDGLRDGVELAASLRVVQIQAFGAIGGIIAQGLRHRHKLGRSVAFVETDRVHGPTL